MKGYRWYLFVLSMLLVAACLVQVFFGNTASFGDKAGHAWGADDVISYRRSNAASGTASYSIRRRRARRTCRRVFQPVTSCRRSALATVSRALGHRRSTSPVSWRRFSS
jgi:hypothetical protein